MPPRSSNKKIVFIVPYPFGIAPGQRFRYEQYLAILRLDFSVDIRPFLDEQTYALLYKPSNTWRKVWGIVKGFTLRVFSLPAIANADFVFIYREAAPVGPPILEWIIAKLLHKKIIYDFDDAIWLTDKHKESVLFSVIRWRSKVASICKWSYKVSCGNEYLCAYARQFSNQVTYNPTTIDTETLHNRKLYTVVKNPSKTVIGWTGSHSTLKYLKVIEAGLIELTKKYPSLELVVIADQEPELTLKNVKFIPWSYTTEITGLLEADIGIMPLPDDQWAKGKCGFKALQYMALELPAIASPVGVNAQIIEHRKNGFLCSTPEEWITAIDQLLTDKELREQIGKAGREKILNEFSVKSNTQNFLNLFS